MSDDYGRQLIAELVAARRRAGLTQADVAAHMGITQQSVARFESGAGGAHLSTFHRYARAVGARFAFTVASADARQWPGLVQPLKVLDLAWDELCGVPERVTLAEARERLAFFMSLADRGMHPHEISQLFDLAITAYRLADCPDLRDPKRLDA